MRRGDLQEAITEMPRKSRSSTKDDDIPDWIDDVTKGSKDDGLRTYLVTQADAVRHDFDYHIALFHMLRVFVALFLSLFFQLLVLASSQAQLALTPGFIVPVALVVYATILFAGVVAGLPSLPSLYTCMMSPFWTLMRAPKDAKLWFAWRATVLAVMWGGLMLLAAYAAVQSAAQLAPRLTFTIPLQEGPIYNGTIVQQAEATDAQYTLYGVVLSMITASLLVLMWFDVAGVGDRDGAWVRWSSADSNDKRENRDRSRTATITALGTLVLYILTGVALVPTPEYVFATWAQHTTMAGTDYTLLFLWTIVAGLITIAGLVLTSTFMADFWYDLFSTVHMGGGSRGQRYSMFEKKRKRRGKGKDVEQDDAASSDTEAETVDSD